MLLELKSNNKKKDHSNFYLNER